MQASPRWFGKRTSREPNVSFLPIPVVNADNRGTGFPRVPSPRMPAIRAICQNTAMSAPPFDRNTPGPRTDAPEGRFNALNGTSIP